MIVGGIPSTAPPADDSCDLNPPRKGRHDSPDLSPPTRGQHMGSVVISKQDTAELSPRRKRSNSISHDSPSRIHKRGRHDSPDLSPRRPGRHDSPDTVPSTGKEQASLSLSPPRKQQRASLYVSPPRRKQQVSPSAHPCRREHDDNADMSLSMRARNGSPDAAHPRKPGAFTQCYTLTFRPSVMPHLPLRCA